MVKNLLIILVSAVALLLVCWILAEYWIRSVKKLSAEKISSLSLWNRIAFAFGDFCKEVNRKKNFGRMKVEDELGSVRMEENSGSHVPGGSEKQSAGRERKSGMQHDKTHRMKENM